jgi:hypothetical protein
MEVSGCGFRLAHSARTSASPDHEHIVTHLRRSDDRRVLVAEPDDTAQGLSAGSGGAGRDAGIDHGGEQPRHFVETHRPLNVVGVHEPFDEMIDGDTGCAGRGQQLPHSGAGAIHTETATIRRRHQDGLAVDLSVGDPLGPGEARHLAGHAITRMRQRRRRQVTR